METEGWSSQLVPVEFLHMKGKIIFSASHVILTASVSLASNEKCAVVRHAVFYFAQTEMTTVTVMLPK